MTSHYLDAAGNKKVTYKYPGWVNDAREPPEDIARDLRLARERAAQAAEEFATAKKQRRGGRGRRPGKAARAVAGALDLVDPSGTARWLDANGFSRVNQARSWYGTEADRDRP